MRVTEELYRELRAVEPARRWLWLSDRAPGELRGHWWLAFIERAEFDASPAHNASPEGLRDSVDLLVDLIDLAERDGMPRHYAAGRLAMLASSLARSEQPVEAPQVDPDRVARRMLATFRLDPGQAVAVAARLRAAGDNAGDGAGDGSGDDPEADALDEIRWLLPDLELLAPYLTGAGPIDDVRQWLDESTRLS